MGSSFLPAEINAAFLWAQLENLDTIQQKRIALWKCYYEHLSQMQNVSFSLPDLPDYATNNAHLFYLTFPTLDERTAFIQFLKEHNISSVFHYLSLHASPFYRDKHDGRVLPESDRYTDTLVRLPMYYELTFDDIDRICDTIRMFYANR